MWKERLNFLVIFWDSGFCKEKYHCTADLLFHMFGFGCFAFSNNRFTCLVKSKPVKQEVSCTSYIDTFPYKASEYLYSDPMFRYNRWSSPENSWRWLFRFAECRWNCHLTWPDFRRKRIRRPSSRAWSPSGSRGSKFYRHLYGKKNLKIAIPASYFLFNFN